MDALAYARRVATPDRVTGLVVALELLDEAVACCIAVAALTGVEDDTRQRAADVAVTEYEAADAVVEVLLDAIIAAGGAPGLLDALEASWDRASACVTASWGHGRKVQAIAWHAYEGAARRVLRVTEALVLPWLHRRVESRREKATDSHAGAREGR